MKQFILLSLLFILSQCTPRENCDDNELNYSESSWIIVIDHTNIRYLSSQGDTINGYKEGYTEGESHSIEDRCGSGLTLIGYTNKFSIPNLEFGISIAHDINPRIRYTTSNGNTGSKDFDPIIHSITVDSVTFSDVYIVNFTNQVNDTLAPHSVSYSKGTGVLSWTLSNNKTFNLLR